MHLNLPGWRTDLVIYVSVAHGRPGCGCGYSREMELPESRVGDRAWWCWLATMISLPISQIMAPVQVWTRASWRWYGTPLMTRLSLFTPFRWTSFHEMQSTNHENIRHYILVYFSYCFGAPTTYTSHHPPYFPNFDSLTCLNKGYSSQCLIHKQRGKM